MTKSFVNTYVCADHDATYHFGFRIGLGTVHAGVFFSFIWARGLELGVWSWAGKKKNWSKYWEAVLASVFCLLFPGSGFVRSPFPFFCAVWDGTVGCGLDVRRLDSFMRYS